MTTMPLAMMNKKTNRYVEVFDIKYDTHGYPHFLVYQDGQWLILSAKHFVPPTNVGIVQMNRSLEMKERLMKDMKL